MFHDIAEAYKVLTDPEKKRLSTPEDQTTERGARATPSGRVRRRRRVPTGRFGSTRGAV